jgi:plasmid stabilization system protein ParE
VTASFAITYTEMARADLITIGERVRDVAGDDTAARFIERIIATAESLVIRPHRQRIRSELGDHVRALGYRKYLVFYTVVDTTVIILRVLHSSQDITRKLLFAAGRG